MLIGTGHNLSGLIDVIDGSNRYLIVYTLVGSACGFKSRHFKLDIPICNDTWGLFHKNGSNALASTCTGQS